MYTYEVKYTENNEKKIARIEAVDMKSAGKAFAKIYPSIKAEDILSINEKNSDAVLNIFGLVFIILGTIIFVWNMRYMKQNDWSIEIDNVLLILGSGILVELGSFIRTGRGILKLFFRN